MSKKQAVLHKVFSNKDDKVARHQSIYDVDSWTIIRKNVLAGFSRSIGSWVFNLLVLGIAAYVLLPMLGDTLNNFFDRLENTLNSELPGQVELHLKK